jgi:hypothetical protein
MIECGEFMDRLEALGVAFALNGERLRVSVAPGVLSQALEWELARRWEAIERLVRSTVTSWGEASPASTPAAAVQLTMGEAA